MGKQIRQIQWNESALWSFRDILDHIWLDSPTNAKRVRTRIINLIKAIPADPMMYRKDELKYNNDGTHRVFNRDGVRVSYKIDPKAIIITRVRHSAQEPLYY